MKIIASLPFPSTDKFWNLSAEVVSKNLSSSEKGLSDAEADARLAQYGPNTLKPDSSSSLVMLFLRQFKSPITILLIAAVCLSIGVGDFTDAVIILTIILISSLLGFWQEQGATRAVSELLKMVQLRCRIVRNQNESELPVENVVPGDVIILSAGDVVPADCLLLSSTELFVDEAAFTGETFPVEKNAGIIPAEAKLSARSNSVFMGSHVISGRAKALAVRTGNTTEFGKIAEKLSSKIPETDFEKGIRRFGYLLMEVTLVLVIAVFAVNLLMHKPPLDSFLFSLALAVGLTPQLLPAIISINLSVGARAMAKEKVIVKRLSSIENLGAMNILCADKTGTMTDGKVTFKDALDSEGNHSEKTMQFAWLNASRQQGFKNPIDDAIRSVIRTDAENFLVQSEIPYDFIRKRLTIQFKGQKNNVAISKGALTSILKICSTVENADGKISPIHDTLHAITGRYETLSAQGYRLLGVAYKNTTNEADFTRADEKDMIFLGFVTLFDPPKKDALETITSLNNLGVQLKLITGDNALVAASLAKLIGIPSPVILTGQQLREMSDGALMRQAPLINIFAEVEPNQKERIIVFLKKSGNVVGFLGDGINDASALHTADVGISVDSAVDVAKEAADIVLLNQDLKVLITGIVVGRKTFSNTMKYIFMATSANFGNMFTMAGSSLFLPFLPLLPKQILFTNLLTDFPQMTIASDRVDSIAVDKPHRWNIRFIVRFMVVFGLLSSFFDVLTFIVLLVFMKADQQVFQTGWFVESVISATLIVLVVRTRLPFFKSLPGKLLAIVTGVVVMFVLILPVMPFAHLLGFVRLPLLYYGWVVLIVSAYMTIGESVKQWFYKTVRDQSQQ